MRALGLVALVVVAALALTIVPRTALADQPQSNSAVPEVPSGSNPQPNGNGGGGGPGGDSDNPGNQGQPGQNGNSGSP